MTLLESARLPRCVGHDDHGRPVMSDVACELNVGVPTYPGFPTSYRTPSTWGDVNSRLEINLRALSRIAPAPSIRVKREAVPAGHLRYGIWTKPLVFELTLWDFNRL